MLLTSEYRKVLFEKTYKPDGLKWHFAADVSIALANVHNMRKSLDLIDTAYAFEQDGFFTREFNMLAHHAGVTLGTYAKAVIQLNDSNEACPKPSSIERDEIGEPVSYRKLKRLAAANAQELAGYAARK